MNYQSVILGKLIDTERLEIISNTEELLTENSTETFNLGNINNLDVESNYAI